MLAKPQEELLAILARRLRPVRLLPTPVRQTRRLLVRVQPSNEAARRRRRPLPFAYITSLLPSALPAVPQVRTCLPLAP